MLLVFLPTRIWLRLENVIICQRFSQKLGLKATIWVSLESVEILATASQSETSPPPRSNLSSVSNWPNIMFPPNSFFSSWQRSIWAQTCRLMGSKIMISTLFQAGTKRLEGAAHRLHKAHSDVADNRRTYLPSAFNASYTFIFISLYSF